MQERLTFRHELKYYCNYHQYKIMVQKLKHVMKLDRHADVSGRYHIRSLYMDDINNKALHEKLAGTRDRVKYRFRLYNHEDKLIHLEKKIKKDNYIAKVKVPLQRDQMDELLQGNIGVIANSSQPLLQEVYYEMKNRLLRPKVIVDYVREAYTVHTGNVRITFDSDLRTGLHSVDLFNKHLPSVRALDENFIILEIKYDEYLPEYVRAVLQLEGLRRQSASKYVICRKLNKFNTWEDQ